MAIAFRVQGPFTLVPHPDRRFFSTVGLPKSPGQTVYFTPWTLMRSQGNPGILAPSPAATGRN
ncbi:hypothetical protein [Oscillatoria acuminata]|uniref:hypothetical protein n=1 Tax=Oscillatoria acuminata TaxID=118323 RepID=UPI0002E782AD|nr:hypothetical protein [Oscillatoria acuminata]